MVKLKESPGAAGGFRAKMIGVMEPVVIRGFPAGTGALGWRRIQACRSSTLYVVNAALFGAKS